MVSKKYAEAIGAILYTIQSEMSDKEKVMHVEQSLKGYFPELFQAVEEQPKDIKDTNPILSPQQNHRT